MDRPSGADVLSLHRAHAQLAVAMRARSEGATAEARAIERVLQATLLGTAVDPRDAKTTEDRMESILGGDPGDPGDPGGAPVTWPEPSAKAIAALGELRTSLAQWNMQKTWVDKGAEGGPVRTQDELHSAHEYWGARTWLGLHTLVGTMADDIAQAWIGSGSDKGRMAAVVEGVKDLGRRQQTRLEFSAGHQVAVWRRITGAGSDILPQAPSTRGFTTELPRPPLEPTGAARREELAKVEVLAAAYEAAGGLYVQEATTLRHHVDDELAEMLAADGVAALGANYPELVDAAARLTVMDDVRRAKRTREERALPERLPLSVHVARAESNARSLVDASPTAWRDWRPGDGVEPQWAVVVAARESKLLTGIPMLGRGSASEPRLNQARDEELLTAALREGASSVSIIAVPGMSSMPRTVPQGQESRVARSTKGLGGPPEGRGQSAAYEKSQDQSR